MFEWIAATAEELVLNIGPAGIFLAMFIETVFPPIPSELVMPLGGYVAYASGQGLFGLAQMVIAGSLGSTLGAVVIYFVALKGGRSFVLKYGRRVGIDKKKIALADSWFERHGNYAVFFGRMAPGVRELVSIPAGLTKMRFDHFVVLTFAGSLVWSAFLGGIGYFLADVWRNIGLDSIFGLVSAFILLSIAMYFIFKHLVAKGKKK